MVREMAGGRIRKAVRVSSTRPSLDCSYTLDGVTVPVVGLEFNLSLRDERYLGNAKQHLQATRFDVEEPQLGVSVSLVLDPPATLLHFPIETVSESEGGLERTYQGLCIVCLWSPAPGRSWTSRAQWAATVRPGTRGGRLGPVRPTSQAR